MSCWHLASKIRGPSHKAVNFRQPNVRYWRKAGIGLFGAERPLLTKRTLPLSAILARRSFKTRFAPLPRTLKLCLIPFEIVPMLPVALPSVSMA
jgi:hypothetical protein